MSFFLVVAVVVPIWRRVRRLEQWSGVGEAADPTIRRLDEGCNTEDATNDSRDLCNTAIKTSNVEKERVADEFIGDMDSTESDGSSQATLEDDLSHNKSIPKQNQEEAGAEEDYITK
jgi:hypothetical protein